MIIVNGFEAGNASLVAQMKSLRPDQSFFWISEAAGADLNPFDAYHLRPAFLRAAQSTRAVFDPKEIAEEFALFAGNYQRHFKRREIEGQDLYHKFMLFKGFVRGLFDSHRVDGVLLTNVPHEGLDLLIYLEARRRGCPVLMFYQTIFPNRFLAVDRIEGIGELPASAGENARPAARDLIARAEAPLMYMKGWIGKALFKKRWSALLRHLVGTLANKNASFFVELVRAWRYERWFMALPRWETERLRKTDYVYFPMHLQPEMTTSALGGAYADQVLALESLSAILPAGWKIIAKENPKQTAHYRGDAFLERLAHVKNLEMAGWATPSLDLIRHSRAVATVTGTAAWEGVCLGKPAVVFGEAWFKGFNGAHRFSPRLDLARVAADGVDRAKLEVDVARFLEACRPGVVDAAYLSLVPDFNETANARAVMDGTIAPWLEKVSGAPRPSERMNNDGLVR